MEMVLDKVPRVNKEKCIGCSSCVVECPAQAIEMIDGKAVINPDKCQKHGICIQVCPTDAIA